MSLMPAPGDLHVDGLLTNISIGYINPNFIAGEIFPRVQVNKQSDIVPKYDQSHWFRNQAAIRAPATKSEGSGFSVDTTDTYFCNRYSFRFEIADEVRDNADEPFNMDRDAAIFVRNQMDLNHEVHFATNFFTTSVWNGGTDYTGGTDFTQWSDYANSQPLIDIATYSDTIEGKTANLPNTLVLGKAPWTKLRWHPDVLEMTKGDSSGSFASRSQVAALADVERVLVGSAIYTTSAEGTAEASVSYSRIFGNHALLLYVPSSASLFTPAAGYTFSWNRVPSSWMWIKRMRNEEREVDIIEGNTYYDMKVTAANSGVLMASAVA